MSFLNGLAQLLGNSAHNVGSEINGLAQAVTGHALFGGAPMNYTHQAPQQAPLESKMPYIGANGQPIPFNNGGGAPLPHAPQGLLGKINQASGFNPSLPHVAQNPLRVSPTVQRSGIIQPSTSFDNSLQQPNFGRPIQGLPTMPNSENGDEGWGQLQGSNAPMGIIGSELNQNAPYFLPQSIMNSPRPDYTSHAPIPSFMGNKYAQNPQNPEFRYTNPHVFGYDMINKNISPNTKAYVPDGLGG